MHGLPGLFVVPGTQILGDDNARAHGHTLAEADQQVDGRAAGAHGSQRVAAHKIAHDDAVGGVVHLLQQVAQDQRQGKQQQVLHDAALGHQVGVLVGWCFDSSHDGSPSQKSTVFLSIAQMRQLHKNAENTTALAAGG